MKVFFLKIWGYIRTFLIFILVSGFILAVVGGAGYWALTTSLTPTSVRETIFPQASPQAPGPEAKAAMDAARYQAELRRQVCQELIRLGGNHEACPRK